MPIIGTLGAASAKGFGFTNLVQASPYWVVYSSTSFGTYGFRIYGNSTQGIYYAGAGPNSCLGSSEGRFGLIDTTGIKQRSKLIYGVYSCIPTGNDYNVAGDSSGNAVTNGFTQNDGVFAAKTDSSNTKTYSKITTSGSLFSYASWDIAADSSGLAIHAGHQTGDLRIVKLASDGASFSFQKRAYLTADPTTTRQLKGIALDSSDNIHAFAADTGGGYVLKFNTDVSSLTWGRKITAVDSVSYVVACITVDSSGNIFLLGYKNASPKTQVIAKYNSSGTYQWAQQVDINSANITSFANSNNRFLSTDSSGNVYALLPGTASGADNCLVKYNSSGTIQWQRQFRRTSCSTGNLEPTGVYVTGTDMYVSFWSNSGYYPILWKLPTDGSKTGSYTLSGLGASWTYAYEASSYTESSATLTESASGGWTTANSSFTLTNTSSGTTFTNDSATFSKVSI